MASNPAEHARRRRALLVVGMHRSGTSYVTSLCAAYNYVLPNDLMRGNAWNPPGYFESSSLVALNDRLLEAARRTWWDIGPLPAAPWRSKIAFDVQNALGTEIEARFGDAEAIVLKDPRTSLLLPIWCDGLHALGYDVEVLLVIRPAGEVAASLLARDGMTPLMGVALWWRYVTSAIAAIRDLSLPHAIVSYRAALDDPTCVGVALKTFGWTVDVEPDSLRAIADPELARSRPIVGGDEAALLARCDALYERLTTTGIDVAGLDADPPTFKSVLRAYRPWRDLFARHLALTAAVREAQRALRTAVSA